MEFTASELWSKVLESAREGMPEQSHRTWLAGSTAVGLSDDELLVEAPSDFHAEWIEDKYGTLLADLVRQIVGRPLDLTFQCTSTPARERDVPSLEVRPAGDPDGAATGRGTDDGPATPSPAPSRRSAPEDRLQAARAANLNERYSFERFVVGHNNQFAAAAANAVAETPARLYNPLFLYGGVGLGKTHLMHAVGHAIVGREGRPRVAYVTTEHFMNELVAAIQDGNTARFRRRFREIDALLVDDVHFLERKEGTQEEFFHTFNALYDAGKQIVLTSDRPPKDLPGVKDRLVSRFEWGLVADIKPPDYETRVAILQKKAEDDDLALDPEVIDFIARSCTSSVRELEGAVIKLLAYSSLRNVDIDVQVARTALHSVLRERREPSVPTLTPRGIVERVAREWGVDGDALASKRRTRDVTEPRQIAMYLIKEILDEPLVRIGRVLGGRDHSTVIHSVRKVEDRIAGDPEFAARIEGLREALEAGA